MELPKKPGAGVQADQDPFDIGNSQRQVFGSFLAVGLVVYEIGVSFCGRTGIKAHRHMGGLLIVEEFDNGIGKAELGIGVFPLGSNSGIPDQRIIRPENKGIGIQQKQSFVHPAKLIKSDCQTFPGNAKPRRLAGLVQVRIIVG